MLSKLINQAFFEGVYPSSLKLAKVISVFYLGLKDHNKLWTNFNFI